MSSSRKTSVKKQAMRPGSQPILAFEMLENRLLMSGYTLATVTKLADQAVSPPVFDGQGDIYYSTRSGEIFEIKSGATTATLLAPSGTAAGRLLVDPAGDLFFGDGVSSFYELPVGDSVPTVIKTGLSEPFPVAIDTAGNIYGASISDGTYNDGTIFEYTPSTQTFTTLASFNGADGSYPYSATVDSAGNLYGIAIYGGGGTAVGATGVFSGPGTVFEIASGSGTITTLANFNAGTVGDNPSGPIGVDSSGNIYGTDSGTEAYGGIFEYNLSTANLSDLYNFTAQNDGTLVSGSGGTIYPGVAVDSSGDVFGATAQGAEFPGGTSTPLAFQYGIDYELPHGSSTLTTIAGPTLVGTTESGGPYETSDGLGIESDGVLIGAAESINYADLGQSGTGTIIYSLTPGSTSGGGGTTGGGGGGGTTENTSPLIPTITKSTLPTTDVSGTAVKGTVSVTVTNSSTAKIAGKETVAVYASTDGDIDSTSIKLDSLVKNLSLKAGRGTPVSFGIKNISLPVGSYTILSLVTDTSGDISTSSTGPTLTVAPARIALAAELTAVSPATISPGKDVAFTLDITNTGNVDSTGLADVAIYLSVDGSALSIPLEMKTEKLTIKPAGKAVALRLKVKVPAGTASGSFYPLVSFVQGTSTFTAAASSPVTVG